MNFVELLREVFRSLRFAIKSDRYDYFVLNEDGDGEGVYVDPGSTITLMNYRTLKSREGYFQSFVFESRGAPVMAGEFDYTVEYNDAALPFTAGYRKFNISNHFGVPVECFRTIGKSGGRLVVTWTNKSERRQNVSFRMNGYYV